MNLDSALVFLQIFSVLMVISTFRVEPYILETAQHTDDLGNCPEGFFHCNTSAQCVSQRLNCDGTADCDDSSDEWHCENEVDALFWDHFFRKQPFGRHDYISAGTCYWNISWLTCPCRDSEILCRFQNLESLPKWMPMQGMRMLDLTGNKFPSLDEFFFELLPDVEILVLKFCSIKVIYPNAFKRLSQIHLEIIYLDQNDIEVLPNEFFPEQNNLRVLILSANKIRILYDYNFVNLDVLVELDLRNNQIEFFRENVFRPLKKLEILYINENRIHSINEGMFPSLGRLHTLSLANNLITDIESNSLHFPQLENLYLAGNTLTKIKSNTFCQVTALKGLHLNDNQINIFENNAFNCLNNLTSLLLTGNKFKTISNSVLKNLTSLSYVYFSWFHLCRAAIHVRVCEPKGDGISSAYHLLDNKLLRGSVWVMATVAIVGNTIVLLGRFFYKNRSNVEHSLYLTHLAASDFLMGIYLIIIALADLSFRGNYIIHEENWRHSIACSLCGFLSTLSCQSSILLLTLVTWDRLMSVTRPLQTRSIRKSKAIFRLFMVWSVSFLLASIPLSSISYFGEYFYGNNGVCIALHIHDPYAKGWEYSAMLFIGLNTLSLSFISYSYIKMLRAIRVSGVGMRSTISIRESAVARRFAIIIITDCACWFPIIAVKVAALYGAKIPHSLYAWLAIFVLPVNSALNPVLYTLTTNTFRQQFRCNIQFFTSCAKNQDIRLQTVNDSCQLSASLGNFGNGVEHRRSMKIKISSI